MNKKPKTQTINGKTFEIPDMELYCEKCKTTNYIYCDMKPPCKCDNCGAELEVIRPEPPMDGGPDEWA